MLPSHSQFLLYFVLIEFLKESYESARVYFQIL